MKKLLYLILTIAAATTAPAEDAHQHSKPIPGPNGGRIIEVAGSHAEFLVRPDRKVVVSFYGEDMSPLAPAEQQVSAVAETASGKVKLEFSKSDQNFVSTGALPDGENFRVVLQIKSAADAKPQNFRINYQSTLCGGCKLAEYACTCAHE